MARFLCDENIFPSTKHILEILGNDVVDIKDTEFVGCSDKVVSKIARKENRIIITMDLDFANIYKFPPSIHPGIIVIRVRPAVPERVDKVMNLFLRKFAPNNMKNFLVILDEKGFRIRK